MKLHNEKPLDVFRRRISERTKKNYWKIWTKRRKEMFARTERLNSMRITTEIRSATECFVTMAQASIPNFVEKCRSHSFSPIPFGRCVWCSVSHMCEYVRGAVRSCKRYTIDADRFVWRSGRRVRHFFVYQMPFNWNDFHVHARATFMSYVKYSLNESITPILDAWHEMSRSHTNSATGSCWIFYMNALPRRSTHNERKQNGMIFKHKSYWSNLNRPLARNRFRIALLASQCRRSHTNTYATRVDRRRRREFDATSCRRIVASAI